MNDVRGIDYQFWQLLRTGVRTEVFPARQFTPKGMEAKYPDTAFFNRSARRIFIEPYSILKRSKTAYLVKKANAVKDFISSFLDYFDYVGVIGDYRAVKRLFEVLDEAYRKRKCHRDHVLHQGLVFFLGLYLYQGDCHIRRHHTTFIETKPPPKTRGYSRGCYSGDKRLEYQFFEQWFYTACFHDTGYIFELMGRENWDHQIVRKRRDQMARIVERLNRFLQQLPEWLAERNTFLTSPSAMRFDPDKNKLDIGALYEINYSYPGESHILEDLWTKALHEIESLDKGDFDHGVWGAKLFLKYTNVADKVHEVKGYERVSKRFAYRNYILPALTIAQHNLISYAEQRGTYQTYFSKKDRDADIYLELGSSGDMNMVIKKAALERDFLTTMLVACDELQEFDRIASPCLAPRELRLDPIEMRLGVDWQIAVQLTADSDNIVVSLQKLE